MFDGCKHLICSTGTSVFYYSSGFFLGFFTSSSCYAFKMKVSIHVMGITVVYSLKNRRTTRRHLLYIPVMPPYVDVRYRLSMEGGEHPHFLSLCTILNWQQKNCKSNVILKNSCKVSQLLLLLFQKYEKCLCLMFNWCF